MISTNELKNGYVIDYEGVLYTIVEFQHVKPGKGGAFVRTKLKNLASGAVVDRTFRAGEKLTRVTTQTSNMQFLYQDGEDLVLMDNESYEQITVPAGNVENVDLLARMGVAMSDAFVGCWHEKFVYNLVRPVTYIKKVIDPKWEPILNTPPFPEYPSGHSTVSGAMDAVLTAFEAVFTAAFTAFWPALARVVTDLVTSLSFAM